MVFAYLVNPTDDPTDCDAAAMALVQRTLVPVLPSSEAPPFDVFATQLFACSTIAIDLRGRLGPDASWRQSLARAITERARVSPDRPVDFEVVIIHTDTYIDLDHDGLQFSACEALWAGVSLDVVLMLLDHVCALRTTEHMRAQAFLDRLGSLRRRVAR